MTQAKLAMERLRTAKASSNQLQLQLSAVQQALDGQQQMLAALQKACHQPETGEVTGLGKCMACNPVILHDEARCEGTMADLRAHARTIHICQLDCLLTILRQQTSAFLGITRTQLQRS